ncbi:dihydrofolate reductase [Agromyces atrinae]|uniref:dihydrofolate reductase n=1 Tax=Agromyces atrinae TaxID=592376 RepID=UPI001F56B220|nr:dihydrofolate reductase [Agromyces atrinae]MCI2958309.1 dihydrofolate reductase [Agromyces atrinae]
MTRIGLVWAQARGGIIGAGGVMPWHLPEDLAHFRDVTGQSSVIMGRRTWESIPPRFRPLPGRRNIVVSRTAVDFAGAIAADSLESALDIAADDGGEVIWIIGGAQIYEQSIARADVLEVTEIDADVEGDTAAPVVDTSWRLVATDPATGWHTSRTGLTYRFLRYER